MENTPQNKHKNMILGALVADAAAMGMHWIYDQERIREVAPDAPEFLPPEQKNYDGVPAFFAHPRRGAGAFSQYGEQTMVMLRTLVTSDGRYDSADFADQFRAHFGYGGAYIGYIDHATRQTLDNFRRFEDAAIACAESLPFDGDAKTPKTLVAKAIPLFARHSGSELRTAFESEVRSIHDDKNILRYSMTLLDAICSLKLPTGAADLQLPAIAKLPGLVAVLSAQNNTKAAHFDTSIASAVRVTNDHPIASVYGEISAHMMAGALTTGSADGAINAGRAVASAEAAALLDQAVAMRDQGNAEVTKHFGMACDLPFGVPSAIHNIATATSFCDAVRRNIYAGGDSCGRAILVGAVMGTIHGIGGAQGIPQDWINKLEAKVEVDDLLTALFG